MEETIDDKKQAETKKLSRNTTLYFFEALASLLIIFIHVRFPGFFGDLIMPGLASFGVPLFFTVSGFYLIGARMSKEELRAKLKKRIIRVLILIALAAAIYFLLDLARAGFSGGAQGVADFFRATFTWKKLLKLVFLNYPLLSLPAWFLFAMLYSYLILYVFAGQFLERRWLAWAFASLLLFWMVFRTIVCLTGASIGGHSLSDSQLYYNWFANGLPFICLGIVLKRHQSFLGRIPLKWVLVVYFASFVLMTLEFSLLRHFFSIIASYYPSHVMNVIAIIALSIKKPDLFSKSKLLNLKGNFTAYVYLFHPALITVVGAFLSKMGVSSNEVVTWLKPLIVLALTLVSALIFNWLVCLIKRASSKGAED